MSCIKTANIYMTVPVNSGVRPEAFIDNHQAVNISLYREGRKLRP